jgi:hypothetical protein
MSTLFNNMMRDYKTMNTTTPMVTAAENPHVNNLTDSFDNAVTNGLDPVNIVKITCIMSLIMNKGITIDDIQTHLHLFIRLCMDSDFSVMDNNILNIVNQINAAKNL